MDVQIKHKEALERIREERLTYYRLLFGDEPRYVNLRIAMVTEDGTRQLIVGLNDVDVQIRREQEYIHNLSAARDRANIDAQTGVKNRRAFVYMEQQMDQLIEKLAEENKKLHAAGLPAIHSGMARYQSERSTEDLYLKAKENMEILHQNVMKTRETDS